MTKAHDAAARFRRLRVAGVPMMLTFHEAWFLSGGVMGKRSDHSSTVPMSRVALRVPDCEHFLSDFQHANQEA